MSRPNVELLNVEYVEYAVRELDQASKLFERLGFVAAGQRIEDEKRSKLFTQGDIRVVLTTSSSEREPAFRFTRTHGDGVMNIGFTVSDAREAFGKLVQLGARAAADPRLVRAARDDGARHESSIQVFGDIRNSFVSYGARTRLEDFYAEKALTLPTTRGRYLQTVDHLTVNLEKGEMDRWADFYTAMFGFQEVRHFDIRTERTGLVSRAMRSPNGRVTMPFNEPTDPRSQIQEFIDRFKGPGIQHIAFHTSNIILCLDEMRAQRFEFLTVPATYYEAVRRRVPNVTENMDELARLGILVDGNESGYLLQIFTEPAVGPLFFEFIQRKGDNGFGDGNFRALFEAIERDQIRRGVLT